MEEHNKIKELILLFLKQKLETYHGDFWNGYEDLLKFLKDNSIDIPLKEVRGLLRELRKEGKVRTDTVFTDDNKICGMGWFLNFG
jgi:hypothetical protein